MSQAQINVLGVLALGVLMAAPMIVGAEPIDGGDGDKLSPRADLEQVITEVSYPEADWPAKWYVTDSDIMLPNDEVVPDGAPATFLKAKKAFDEVDGDFEFVMPGDNVSDLPEDDPSLAS